MTTKKYKYVLSDVLPNILSRLPVKSLKQFECVCKSWYDLIKDPNFAIQHLHHSQSVNQHCLLQKEDIRTSDVSVNGHVSLLCLDEITQHVSRHRLNLPSVFFDISGPCNGIYCFIRLDSNFNLDLIALANVSLREFKVVPDFCISHPRAQRQRVNEWGFGFDRKTSDYKLVLTLSYADGEPGVEFNHTRKEVAYSLRSNSWRELDRTFPYDAISDWNYCLTSGTHVSGNPHWLATPRFADIDLRYAVLSFDMVDEVFRLIYLPKLRDFERRSDTYVNMLYNDSLSVAVRPKSYTPDKTCEIWILQDYGDDESWTKLVTIGTIEGIARSLHLSGIWRNGELLFRDGQEQAISYNPNTRKITQQFRVYGPLRAYSESLVSIVGDQRDEQNMLFDMVKESDDPTLQQPSSSRGSFSSCLIY